MMKKNMKKMAGLLVMAMSLSIGGAFAAAPAFDTPQEWLTAMNQQTAQKLKEEASMHGYSENYDYMAAPAFDTPQEWLAACQQQKANKLKEEASMHGYNENYDYMAAPAFDTPQ
ncbi:MAG: hypothetical protein ACI4N8_09345 [Megasphaera sp.]|uniref:hypothetical protein n=1 Tax=Megasphaera sp. TaxID=2023260 RepID=UPI003F08FA4F